jgi:lysophospholipase L1-like esterase
MSPYRLLCLGDSYTVGEMVPAKENFPNQTIDLLRKSGYDFGEPEIVAMTGWATDELQIAIQQHPFKNYFDFVTLLIGVNNQYRGRNVEDYRAQFEALVRQAIQFANGNKGNVIVLSIPDWSVTPFAADRDRIKIAKDIKRYNQINKEIASAHDVRYLDITPGTRKAADDGELLAADGLHPSGKEYAMWSEKIYQVIQQELEKTRR